MTRHSHYLLFLVLALLLLLNTDATLIMTDGLVNNISTDQFALLAFKSYMINLDSSHILSTNWSVSTHVCSWVGISCGSPDQRVTRLDISNMGINGSLPPQLGNLSFLQYVNFSNNYFKGNIPQELSRLSRLRVFDSYLNDLEGEIPSWFSLLPDIRHLDLGNNSFTGLIPPSLSNMSNLEYMDLQFNDIQGEIPKEMGELVSLKSLVLHHNKLTGSIPSTLFNISKMEALDLSRNSLYGNLPDSICGDNSMLKELILSFNELNGEIPTNLSNCLRLQVFSLSHNRFSGSIPREIGNLGSLELLYLGRNNFTGAIPYDISNISMLKELDLHNNHFKGDITSKIFNISSLQFINIARNDLFGILPPDMCSHLRQLEAAYLGENNLYGPIPNRLYECSALKVFDMSLNKLSGSIPNDLGNSTKLQVLGLSLNKLTGVIPREITNLHNLEEFYLDGNNLRGSFPTPIFNMSTLRFLSFEDNELEGELPSDLGRWLPHIELLDISQNNFRITSSELSFITSLANCGSLRVLDIGKNPLNGVLPSSIGNLSTSLVKFYANDCGLRGSISDGIGNLTNLIFLTLSENDFTGQLPNTLANAQSLQELFLFKNRINGTIPKNICDLQNLETLDMGDNEFSGFIPHCIGNMASLRNLYLPNNKLESTIPQSLWQLQDILELNFSSNYLTGDLSVEIGKLSKVIRIDMSLNQFSGIIPVTIGELQSLSILNLSNNMLHGSIPDSIAEIVNLMSIDLSRNNLSGVIPLSMEKLLYLQYLNVSFNNLTGEIPSHGPFMNFTSQSFMFNKGLCGDPRYNVTFCPKKIATKRKSKFHIILIVLGIFSFSLVIMILVYKFVRDQNKNKAPTKSELWLNTTPSRISYYELLEATEGYNESNLIGSGSFGIVYRGILRNGKVVAVKVFCMETRGAFDSFEVECEILRNLRHKNLLKVIGCCSNENFKALILEYMPSGSLEKILYAHNLFLDLVQRISIMIDVAYALEYLHYGYLTPIIHCDIKPSNILVDEHMVAHLSDFGVAKLLGEGEASLQTITLATLGYIAPEFGMDGRLSIKTDVYSYGITLMEVFTRMKPNDESFAGNLTLRSWVKNSMPNGIIQIIDPNLLKQEKDCSTLKLNCLHSIMDLALDCSSTSPRDRVSIKDVTAALKNIKKQLLGGLACDG